MKQTLLALAAFVALFAPLDGPAADPSVVNLDVAAGRIDAVIEADLKRHGQTPNPNLTDEQFLRRIYLDISGRIPTLAEARRFLSAPQPQRRTELIDELLRSEGYVSHYFNYWADVLRARNASSNLTLNVDETWEAHYTFWIKQALCENRPYDDFVRELLTAVGSLSSNGATGYLLRDEGNRLANYEATTAVFLGVQLECAQCHDHPYDDWTQRQYHEGFAFINKTISLRAPDSAVQELLPNLDVEELRRQEREMLREIKSQKQATAGQRGKGKSKSNGEQDEPSPGRIDQEARRALGGFENHYVRHLDHAGSMLPRDFRGTDGKAGEKISPRTIYGDILERRAGEAWPVAYARWLTSRENPRFPLVIANRLWTKVFGIGFAGAPTETLSIEQAPNPELARLLMQTMLAVDFDLRRFLAILCRTQTYQRAATTGDVAHETTYRFPGPALRRLSAEQIWDSFVVSLRNSECDLQIQRRPPSSEAFEELRNVKSSDEFWSLMRERARRKMVKGEENRHRLRDADTQYVRAAELSSPAPTGHFLRVFGQSERLLVDKAWASPTIPQALMLLNGPLLEAVADSESVFGQALEAAASPEAKVRTAFLAVLTREPNSAELALALEASGDSEEFDAQRLVRSLLNSRQFLFLR